MPDHSPGGPEAVLVWGRAVGLGGTETRMLETIGAWRSSSVPVTSLLPMGSQDSALADALTQAGSAIVWVRNGRDLGRAVSDLAAPFVICFGLRASLQLRALKLARWNSGLRVIEARNGLEHRRPRLMWKFDVLTSRLVTRFVVNSEAVRSQLVSHGIRSEAVHVLRSAVSDEWVSPVHGARDPRRIVMIGNRRPEKNQSFGLSVIEAVGGPADVVVFTDDATELRGHPSVRRGDSTLRVRFTEGHRVRPADLDDRGLLFHPSLSESLPRAVIEAKARGLRVVATDVGDTATLLSSGDRLVRPGDFQHSVAQLRAAMQEPAAPLSEPVAALTVRDYASALLRLCRP